MGDVKHTFVSPVTDAGDPDLVGPDEWNDEHDVTLTASDVGADATGTAAAAVAAHEADTTSVHGISNTANLETTSGAQTKVDAHVNDTSDAHDASAISVDSATLVGTGTDVQAVFEEMDNDIAALKTPDYLVGTATGTLSGEIAVGTTPGGELGNTWSAPTVDATHSGSSHASIQSAAEATAASALSTHESDKTSVHGFTNTDDVARIAGEITGTGASPTIASTHSGSAHHSAVTIGADTEHSLSGQVLSGVDASTTQKGHVTIGSTAPPAVSTSGAAGAASTEAASKNHVHAHEAAHVAHDTVWDAKGDIVAGTAADTAAVLSAGSNGQMLTAQSGQTTGLQWANHHTQINFSKSGTLSTSTGAFRWYNDTGRTLTFSKVRASAGTAPTTQSILCDVNVDGTTIWSTQGNRVAVAAAANTGTSTTFNTTTIADGSYITVDVDQVGSGTTGSDLIVTVWMTG